MQNQKKNSNLPYYIGLGVVIILFGIFAYMNITKRMDSDSIVDSSRTDAREAVADKFLMKHNEVPPFELVNQQGKTITNQYFDDKVYIVEFFFTSCPGICKIMNANMVKIQEAFKDEPDFGVLSVSIDPVHDSPEVLQAYAEKYGVTIPHWELVTGDKDSIYKLARNGFSSYVGENVNVPGGFEHSGNFALVDKNGFLRSRKDDYGNYQYVYDGLEEKGIKQIIEDATLLINE